LGAIFIALGFIVKASMSFIDSADTLKAVPTLVYLSSFVLFGIIYKRHHGSLWPASDKKVRRQYTHFLLGAGTAVCFGTFAPTALEHHLFNVFVFLLSSLIFIPLFSLQIAALIFFGSWFCGVKKEHVSEIKFEVVAEGQLTTQLEIIRARLDAEGIPAFILNGDMNRILPMGIAQLEVPEDRIDDARNIIAAINSGELKADEEDDGHGRP